jgi:uncharacterized protein YjbK
MEKFYELSEDTKKEFFKVFETKAFPVGVAFQFIGNEKQKELIKISKIQDQYSFILKKEILVSVNEDLIQVFDEESKTILIEQEIDRLHINMDTGKIKLIKTDLNTFSSLVNKYGVEKVARANKVEELYDQQKKDGTGEFIV